MNAPTKLQYVQQQVSGQLLFAGYRYDDGLVLDLYGSVDDGDHIVESIAVAGTTVEIGQLFSGVRLQNMSLWLDLKESAYPASREWAERHKWHAAKGF